VHRAYDPQLFLINKVVQNLAFGMQAFSRGDAVTTSHTVTGSDPPSAANAKSAHSKGGGASCSIALVGFDSAWTDKAAAPGAICAVLCERGSCAEVEAPRLLGFSKALEFIGELRARVDLILVAIDQPTLVPNLKGSRPVDRDVASLISWVGGGVQPANRRKLRMFDDDAPIWRFLSALGGVEDPERARVARSGLFYFEVFPALALCALEDSFCDRGCGPRYNPTRKTFRLAAWARVVAAATREAEALGCTGLAAWLRALQSLERPRKPDQDLLDSAICALVAARWRLRERERSLMVGDLQTGYMVAPSSERVRARFSEKNIAVM
jgi:predicted RNase H-like nuclease